MRSPGINGFLFILGAAAAVLDRGNLLLILPVWSVFSGFFRYLISDKQGQSHRWRRYQADVCLRSDPRVEADHSGVSAGMHHRLCNPSDPYPGSG